VDEKHPVLDEKHPVLVHAASQWLTAKGEVAAELFVTETKYHGLSDYANCRRTTYWSMCHSGQVLHVAGDSHK
jgi:hypothetical protein